MNDNVELTMLRTTRKISAPYNSEDLLSLYRSGGHWHKLMKFSLVSLREKIQKFGQHVDLFLVTSDKF